MAEKEPDPSELAQEVAELLIADSICYGADLQQFLNNLQQLEARGVIQEILDAYPTGGAYDLNSAFQKILASYGQTEEELSAADIQEALKAQLAYYLELKTEEQRQYANRLMALYGMTIAEEKRTSYDCEKALELGELVVRLDGEETSAALLAYLSLEDIAEAEITLLGKKIQIIITTLTDPESADSPPGEPWPHTNKNTSYLTRWDEPKKRLAPYTGIYPPEMDALDFLSREYTERIKGLLTTK